MSTGVDRLRVSRFLFLLAALSLALLVPGEQARTAPLATISVSMSNPACIQPSPPSGNCSIQIRQLSATGSDATFARVEVSVNGKLRVYMAGFFENSASLTSEMLGKGLAVSCGRPNDGGKPEYGKSYTLAASAYMSGGESASDSATVYCPYFDGKVYLPILRR